MPDRKYKIITQPEITRPTSVESNCNAIIFTNRGDITAIVNGERIETNQFISNSGQADEMDTTKYNVTFEDVTGDCRLYVRRKIYEG